MAINGGTYNPPPVGATNSTYCYARCTAGIQGGGGGELDITWDGSLYFSESETFRNASNKKQLIVPSGKGGKYRIRILLNILNNGTGASYLRVLINGTEMDRVSVSGPAGAVQQMELDYRAILSAGDVITATTNIAGNGYFIGDGYGGIKGGCSISVESWT